MAENDKTAKRNSVGPVPVKKTGIKSNAEATLTIPTKPRETDRAIASNVLRWALFEGFIFNHVKTAARGRPNEETNNPMFPIVTASFVGNEGSI